MTVAPLRRDGNDSGSRTPLDYAPWEPETEMNSRYASLPPSGVRPGHAELQSRLFQQPTGMPIESDTGPGSEYLETVDNTASTWGTTSGECSPWVQFGESGLDGDNGPVLHSGYGNYSTNTTPNGSSLTAHHEMNGPSDGLDPQMLEIDWVPNTVARSRYALRLTRAWSASRWFEIC
jgi:hypothetical protein